MLASFVVIPSYVRAADGNDDIIVTASRQDLTGVANSASQGSATKSELDLRPVVRVGELFEAIPGLVVTIHSGEGKANQYLLRGYNLDHGTDLANFVDDIPVNRPTNAHGQGYTDLNFIIPQIANGLDFTKGPYDPSLGDFGAVGAAHLKLADTIPTQVSLGIGTLGYQELYGGTTLHIDSSTRLLSALDLSHYDGPWSPPDDFQKLNAALRVSHGTTRDGFDITALYYKSSGALTTDQPLRAFATGLIGYYGTLDPSDASRSERFSLSGHYQNKRGAWHFRVNAYLVKSEMTLWNNFTHYLTDPINGDQEQQDESRTTFGGAASVTWYGEPLGLANEVTVGAQARNDTVYVDRKHTRNRATLSYCEAQFDLTDADAPYLPYPAINGNCNADAVKLLDLAPYFSVTTHWTPWLRSVIGLREEFYRAIDHSLTSAQALMSFTQTLFQPKASLIFRMGRGTELYLNAGRGFHSDDARGVIGTVPGVGVPLAAGATPLLAANNAYEIGFRSKAIRNLDVQIALFQQDSVSELIYDQDMGQDQASAPSRRRGIEVSAQYHPLPWIELNSDLAVSEARYRGNSAFLATYGLSGPYIANAPSFIGSVGVLVDGHGRWSGGLQWRILGPYPLDDGRRYPEDTGYRELNIDIGYRITGPYKLKASVFNALNTKANAAAYYYAARLPGEPAGGISDYQIHRFEPRSGRLTLTATY